MAAVARAPAPMGPPGVAAHQTSHSNVNSNLGLSRAADNGAVSEVRAANSADEPSPPDSFMKPSPPTGSPNSPKQHFEAMRRRTPSQINHPTQIGGYRRVGFVPAALRPTERPRPPPTEAKVGHSRAHSIATLHNGPPTPPGSLHNSTDDLAGVSNGPASRKSSDSSSSSAGLNKLTIDTSADTVRPVTRGSLLDPTPTTATFTGLFMTTLMSQNGPPPTRAHWVPDAVRDACEAKGCSSKFGTFTRRHHCRRCGGIFCHRHVTKRLPLDASARMIPTPFASSNGSGSSTPRVAVAPSVPYLGHLASPVDSEDTEYGWWKSCDGCWSMWVEWVQGLQAQQENGEDISANMHLPIGINTAAEALQRKASVVGSISGSVPGEGNWSTF